MGLSCTFLLTEPNLGVVRNGAFHFALAVTCSHPVPPPYSNTFFSSPNTSTHSTLALTSSRPVPLAHSGTLFYYFYFIFLFIFFTSNGPLRRPHSRNILVYTLSSFHAPSSLLNDLPLPISFLHFHPRLMRSSFLRPHIACFSFSCEVKSLPKGITTLYPSYSEAPCSIIASAFSPCS